MSPSSTPIQRFWSKQICSSIYLGRNRYFVLNQQFKSRKTEYIQYSKSKSSAYLFGISALSPSSWFHERLVWNFGVDTEYDVLLPFSWRLSRSNNLVIQRDETRCEDRSRLGFREDHTVSRSLSLPLIFAPYHNLFPGCRREWGETSLEKCIQVLSGLKSCTELHVCVVRIPMF